jgi:GAF domain-containing protein
MPENFGARLRQRREGQQIGLGTIAEQTKIKLSLLEGLERDDVSHWPSGIFRRAFIRAYAHAIGLEPDVIVREFLEIYPDPAEVVATVPGTAAGGYDTRPGGPPTRLRNIVGSAIGSLSRLGARTAPKVSVRIDETSHYVPQRPQIADLLADALPAAPDEPVDWPAAAAVDCADDALDDTASTPASAGLEDQAVVLEPPGPANPPGPDLLAVANLCTELGRVDSTTDLAPLLGEATRLLEAVGLIIWMWDPLAVELRPALAHGYSERVLAQIPRVDRDSNNATAAAFRSAQTCVVNSNDLVSGALVAPLIAPSGCVGVLAIELQDGREESESVRALAMILAAQLAALVGAAQPSEASDRRLA